MQVGDANRDRIELGAHCKRQTAERALQIELRQRLPARDEPAAHRERAQQLLEHRLHLEHHMHALCFEQRNVSAELQGVTEALLCVYEQRLVGERLVSQPARLSEAALESAPRLELEPRFEERPAFAELPPGEL